ncbi:hypothetical protein [Pontibacter sp. G13]|uniref:hypothetical protein n=1 Tax=Pontibacter sp. G13 TaxID=3074898 RepID=UPI00288AA275|nr:hypothetical protein [Pontibacter sp. G13]WNJ20965.1 hypothetical protein RJD25_10855 [Pontibacter sp. G13]
MKRIVLTLFWLMTIASVMGQNSSVIVRVERGKVVRIQQSDCRSPKPPRCQPKPKSCETPTPPRVNPDCFPRNQQPKPCPDAPSQPRATEVEQFPDPTPGPVVVPDWNPRQAEQPAQPAPPIEPTPQIVVPDPDPVSPRRNDPLWFPSGNPRMRPPKSSPKEVFTQRIHLQFGFDVLGTYQTAMSNGILMKHSSFISGWNWNFFAGYRLNRRGRKRGNIVGLWYNRGGYGDNAVNRMVNPDPVINVISESSSYREWQAGIMLREWLRLSMGTGFIEVESPYAFPGRIDYQVFTAGASFKISKRFKLNPSASFMFGSDISGYVFRPSIGLAYRMDFWKRKIAVPKV